ncbi:7522_t:CDS:2 [Ambispora gerdemannii]|uniref:7522_t:CDS:1 n=1 Tax=Ambispora gerdemannii TaxID=144530 RepID=A0A9N9AZU6_9GLOM|nr:7522_t:CDS:2 [Ambispora gerdemannii]
MTITTGFFANRAWNTIIPIYPENYISLFILGFSTLSFLIIFLIPKHHVCKRTAKFPLPSQKLWNVVTDFSSYPRWRSTLTKIETSPHGHIPPDGFEWFRELTPYGSIKYRVIERYEGKMFKQEIVREKGVHLSGSWIIEFESIGKESTQITITEQVTIHKAIPNIIGFLNGHNRNIDQFLTDLANKFEQVVVLKDVIDTQK